MPRAPILPHANIVLLPFCETDIVVPLCLVCVWGVGSKIHFGYQNPQMLKSLFCC